MNNEWIDQILTVWLSLELEPKAKPWGTEVHFAFLLNDIKIYETIRYFLGILNKRYDNLTKAAESFASWIYLLVLTDEKRHRAAEMSAKYPVHCAKGSSQCIVPSSHELSVTQPGQLKLSSDLDCNCPVFKAAWYRSNLLDTPMDIIFTIALHHKEARIFRAQIEIPEK